MKKAVYSKYVRSLFFSSMMHRYMKEALFSLFIDHKLLYNGIFAI